MDTHDACLWNMQEQSMLRCTTGDMVLRTDPSSCDPEWSDNTCVYVKDVHGENIPQHGLFRLVRGPDKLPSQYLTELRDTGLVRFDHILDPTSLADVHELLDGRKNSQRQLQFMDQGNESFWVYGWLPAVPAAVKAYVNPSLIAVVKAYLEVDEIKFNHQPVAHCIRPGQQKDTCAKLDENMTAPNCWHSDYPYRPGNPLCLFDKKLGVAVNICLDEYADGSGTRYIPGSHLAGRLPTDGFLNESGKPPIEQEMKCPAGSAIIYDTRLWHRGCPECSRMTRNRCSLLQNIAAPIVPQYFEIPGEIDAYLQSDVPATLTSRERSAVDSMWVRSAALKNQAKKEM